MSISHDPVVNAIYSGIKQGIKVTLDNKCYPSALTLIYAGIDAMANLGRTENQKVRSDDFIRWVDRYIQIDTKEHITGNEFYSARCGVLHTYGVESTLTRKGTVRKLGYMIGGYPPIRYNPEVSKDLVLLDILTFADAFFKGVDRFLVDMFADSQNRRIIEARLQKLLCVSELKHGAESS